MTPTDDGWTPSDRSILEHHHPDSIGVSGLALSTPFDPQPHWFRPWFSPAYRRFRCGLCGRSLRGHRKSNRRALAELRRRKGKAEEECPRCLGTTSYVDADGLNPFRSCPRCDGWGAIWERDV